MTISNRPRWSLGRGNPPVPSSWQATVVHWHGSGGKPEVTGLHDYRALYAAPGLYEAVYLIRLGMRSPQVLASVCPPVRRAQLQVLDVGAGTGSVGAALR